MDELYIGLMSGTSLDGIDAVLVDLSGNKFRLLESLYLPYPDAIKDRIGKIIQDYQRTSTTNDSGIDSELASLNAQAINTLLENSTHSKNNINAIGYHGQTVFHQPEGDQPTTVQLGDPNVLAEQTEIKVVADFRSMDMAVGGQGAPLVPAFHQFLFRDATINRAILNIGGIANLTILPADNNQPITGFDTGPGNCLLDEWISLHHKQSFDEGGQWAKQGQLDNELLETLLSDTYFSKAPPKSTGREYFHLDWVRGYSNIDSKIPQNIQTTLTYLTASTIVKALEQYAPDTQQVFVCGGGAHNQFLCSLIQKQLGDISLASTDDLGLDPDWVEACAFAWLAQQRIQEHPSNIPSVTGARKAVLLGKIFG